MEHVYEHGKAWKLVTVSGAGLGGGASGVREILLSKLGNAKRYNRTVGSLIVPYRADEAAPDKTYGIFGSVH